MFNRITVIGRLTAEPEMSYVGSGEKTVEKTLFTVAVDRSYKNSSGYVETDFIPVETWRSLARTCAENLSKGRLVCVDGQLQIDKYEKNGQRRSFAKIKAGTVKFLDWPKKEKNSEEGYFNEVTVDDPLEDIPF